MLMPYDSTHSLPLCWFGWKTIQQFMEKYLDLFVENEMGSIREIQTTFVLTCGKVGMWEWNSRKPSRREHSFFMCCAFAYIN